METFFKQLQTDIKRPRIYPVVHVKSIQQIDRELEKIQEAQADGVFLISHDDVHQQFAPMVEKTVNKWNNLLVGVNFLDLDVQAAAQTAYECGCSAVWVDNLRVNFEQTQQDYAQETWSKLKSLKNPPMLFGGVAFKYQKQPQNLHQACLIAKNYCDVVCTSGSGTGKAADTQKIADMKKALDNHPLSSASGITPENVEGVKHNLDAILVATGVSDGDFYSLNTEKITALIQNSQR